MSLYVDIEKRLGTFHLRAQFEAPDKTMALLGASGCGKSMTLKCIAGIVTPDRGRIVLGDRVLFDSEKHIDLTPQQRRVGYLFQQYALFPTMTVEQNILCGIRSGDRAEKRRVLAEKLRLFRLEGLEKKHPAQLSGGQQQRVALARILCAPGANSICWLQKNSILSPHHLIDHVYIPLNDANHLHGHGFVHIVGAGLAQDALLLHFNGHIGGVEELPGGNASQDEITGFQCLGAFGGSTDAHGGDGMTDRQVEAALLR